MSLSFLPPLASCTNTIPKLKPHNPNLGGVGHRVLPNLLSLALAVTIASPLPSHAIPSLNSQSPPISLTTPFSQSKNLQLGLENGKIRPCPSINPGCISTNPKSSSFAFPWRIPSDSMDNATQKLREAILKTQKNVKFQPVEDTPYGQYLQAEVDGGFGRDVLEFLVKGDVVVYRCMAMKVTYVYPFTTALGDSKGQEARLKQINDQLGCRKKDSLSLKAQLKTEMKQTTRVMRLVQQTTRDKHFKLGAPSAKSNKTRPKTQSR